MQLATTPAQPTTFAWSDGLTDPVQSPVLHWVRIADDQVLTITQPVAGGEAVRVTTPVSQLPAAVVDAYRAAELAFLASSPVPGGIHFVATGPSVGFQLGGDSATRTVMPSHLASEQLRAVEQAARAVTAAVQARTA